MNTPAPSRSATQKGPFKRRANQSMTKIIQFRASLDDWLQRNKLATDCHIYSRSEWNKRNEEFLNEAHLIIVTEGELCMLLNYSDDYSAIMELNDLLESFGCYYELGHHWSVGIYSTGEDMESVSSYRYQDKLRDQRWLDKRSKVIQRSGGCCEDCGSEPRSLEVHHCYYMPRCHPWQYPLDSLRALCRDCHEKRTYSEIKLRALLARASRNQIEELYNSLSEQYEG